MNPLSSWPYSCILIMREAEVGLVSKSAAWCGKSKSRGIALRSISETRQKNLEQVSRSWTTQSARHTFLSDPHRARLRVSQICETRNLDFYVSSLFSIAEIGIVLAITVERMAASLWSTGRTFQETGDARALAVVNSSVNRSGSLSAQNPSSVLCAYFRRST